MHYIWIILGLLILIVSFILFITILVFKKAPRKVRTKVPKPAPRPVSSKVKDKALYSIDKTIQELNSAKIDTRESYQRLSIIMREFVSSMTGKNVTSLTLYELKEMGFGPLSVLIADCYAPELAMKTQANFRADAEKAKGMVRLWN